MKDDGPDRCRLLSYEDVRKKKEPGPYGPGSLSMAALRRWAAYFNETAEVTLAPVSGEVILRPFGVMHQKPVELPRPRCSLA